MADDFGGGRGFDQHGGMPPWAQPQVMPMRGQNLAPALVGMATATGQAPTFDSSQEAYDKFKSGIQIPTYEDWSKNINENKAKYESMMANPQSRQMFGGPQQNENPYLVRETMTAPQSRQVIGYGPTDAPIYAGTPEAEQYQQDTAKALADAQNYQQRQLPAYANPYVSELMNRTQNDLSRMGQQSPRLYDGGLSGLSNLMQYGMLK